MSQKENLGWGILSTGRISNWFCSDFHKVTDGHLVSVCSRSMESAEGFARKHSIQRAYDNYEAMLSDPNVDVIYIGTPHNLHFENAKQALEAGKAVLCEKPLTVSVEEAEELIQISRRTGAYLMEAMWTYFLPAIAQAKDWINQNKIGQLLHIKTDFGYPVPYDPMQREWNAKLGGGALLEMGIYPIAIAEYFSTGRPKNIKAFGSKAPNGVEQDVSIVMEYETVTAMLGTSFLCRQRNAAHLIGTEGYIVIPDAFRASECHLYVLDDLVERKSFERSTAGYEYQAISMVKDIRSGKHQSDIVSHDTSLNFQKIIQTVKDQLG